MTNNLIIIGSGPAGLTAGIYAARSGLKPILLQGDVPGGQLTWTTKVENWPGAKTIMGPELMQSMEEHAKISGCELISKTVTKVDFSSYPYKIFTKNNSELTAKSIIIATGAIHRKLGVQGEEKYWGKGVSVCSVCDGPFYKDQEIAIIGSGNSAMTEGYHLLKFAKKLTIIHIGNKLSATDPIMNEVINNPKVEIIYNSEVKKIDGDGEHITNLEIEDKKENKIFDLPVSGIFISIGLIPNSSIFKNQLEMDDRGYILRKSKETFNVEGMQTSKPGIFAAGDVTDSRYRQAITAAGQGCMAALDCYNFLQKKLN